MTVNEPTSVILASVRALLQTMTSSGDARTAKQGFTEAQQQAIGILDAAMAGAGASRNINIKQATALTGVSRRTIYNWINAGRVEYIRTPGGAIRIVESSLWKAGQRK